MTDDTTSKGRLFHRRGAQQKNELYKYSVRAKGTFKVRLCGLVVHKLGLRVMEELGKSTRLFMTFKLNKKLKFKNCRLA